MSLLPPHLLQPPPSVMSLAPYSFSSSSFYSCFFFFYSFFSPNLPRILALNMTRYRLSISSPLFFYSFSLAFLLLFLPFSRPSVFIVILFPKAYYLPAPPFFRCCCSSLASLPVYLLPQVFIFSSSYLSSLHSSYPLLVFISDHPCIFIRKHFRGVKSTQRLTAQHPTTSGRATHHHLPSHDQPDIRSRNRQLRSMSPHWLQGSRGDHIITRI